EYTLPTHGLITNAGKAHLEGFGGEEGVRKGKGELFDYLRTLTHGVAFVNWDYDYLHEMSKGISGVIKYGTTEEAHIVGAVFKSDPFLQVSFRQGLEGGPLATNLVGDYNLPNILAAVTIGKTFNVAEPRIREALSSYVPSNSRSQLVERGTNKIILDAYNANPSSMRLAIENFASLNNEKKVLMLGGMAELGAQSLEEHKAIIDLIRRTNWTQVVLVGGDFLRSEHPYLQFDDSVQAREWWKQQDFNDTYFLVKGSRSMKMEKILEP
ncbi:MAG TPA: Mur ligase family protein, partial [Chitinophagaceae bacterium]|nr:Mur ligase family protein [Chitinophagaceae bacterium]